MNTKTTPIKMLAIKLNVVDTIQLYMQILCIFVGRMAIWYFDVRIIYICICRTLYDVGLTYIYIMPFGKYYYLSDLNLRT